MKQPRNPSTVHPPLAAYAHQIDITGPQRWLVLSGQVGMRPDGTLPPGALEQLDVALENVIRNVQAATMDVEDIVKLTFYLVADPEAADAAKRRAVIAARLPGGEVCTTLLFVAGLASSTLKVEIDAWACREA
jgi:2-iminobutanoate/2-iminopropanoate deaminase